MKFNSSIITGIAAIFFAIILMPGCKEQKKEVLSEPETATTEIPTNIKWSERMALSEMKRNPEAWQIDHKEKPKWDYVHGLVVLSIEKLYARTGDSSYFNYAKGYADTLIDSSGTITGYKFKDFNIDMINAGKILFDLYDKTSDERYLTAMKTLRKQLEEHPRTTEGGFWHKNRYPHQMWLDGLYMGTPFYAEFNVRFENSDKLDDIANQFTIIHKHALDKKTGLLYHGWDESREQKWADKTTGTSPNFWSRSLGWYAMALADVLDYFPNDHPKRKELIQYFNDLCVALKKYQHESGLWYQVTDGGDKDGNYLEASGSAMFAYAMAKGANKGYLAAEYRDISNKAFDGLTNDLIKVADDGEVTITQVCAVAGLGGDPYRDGSFEYYVNEKKKDNDPKATGPFIMAALELDR